MDNRKKRPASSHANEVLSQDEIDQLLSSISSGTPDEIDDVKAIRKRSTIRFYDFKRPRVYTRDNMRSMCFIAEKAVRKWSSHDIEFRVRVASVDSLTFEEHILSCPTPGFFLVGKDTITSLDPKVYMEVLGLDIDDAKNRRDLSPKECKRVKKFINPVLKSFYKDLRSVGIKIRQNYRIETNPTFIQELGYSSVGMEVCFEVRYREAEGLFYVFFPYSTMYKNKKFLCKENVYAKLY